MIIIFYRRIMFDYFMCIRLHITEKGFRPTLYIKHQSLPLHCSFTLLKSFNNTRQSNEVFTNWLIRFDHISIIMFLFY